MNAKAIPTRPGLTRPARLRTAAKILLGILVLLGALPPAPSQAQDAAQLVGGTISTFAGSTDPNAPATFDSVQANGSKIAGANYLLLDAGGNLYFSFGSSGGGVSVVYGGNKVPPILALRVPHPHKGYQYLIAGSLVEPTAPVACAPPGACGDGGPALLSTNNSPLILPEGMAVDASGNLFIADEVEQSIRKVSAADGTIGTIAGDPNHLQNGYSGDGGLATSALLNYPDAVKVSGAGEIYIADAGNYLIRSIDASGKISTVAGNAAAAAAANGSGSLPPSCAASTDNCGEGGPPLSATLGFVAGMSFDPNGNLFLAETDSAVVREIDLSASSAIIHTVAGTLRTPCAPPSKPAAPSCGDTGTATSALLFNPSDVLADASENVVISDNGDNAARLVTASDGKMQTIAGQISSTAGYASDNNSATAAPLNTPFGLALDSAGNLYIAESYTTNANGGYTTSLIRQVTPPGTKKQQAIRYTAPPAQTYGGSQLDLNNYFTNTSGSGINLTYELGAASPATLNGSIVTITGAGTIAVIATLSGNSTWAEASKTENISVAAATLKVTGPANFLILEGQPVPTTIGYIIAGFASGDSQSSVLTGAPDVAVVDAKGVVIPAGTVLPAGTYTVKVKKGTLTLQQHYAQDYVLDFVDSTLLVTQGKPQTVEIGSFTPPSTYGDPNSSFSFTATATSGLAAQVTITGPVKSQQTTAGWNVTVVGAGQVTITATQGGNATYAPATKEMSFIVNPAILTITPGNVRRSYNTPNPAFSYVSSGFVGSDTAAVLSGAPLYATKATSTSDVGTYAISATQGNLFAQNYSFTFGTGTLTITQAAQTITFGDVKDLAYSVNEIVTASSNSGLPVQLAVSGAATGASSTSSISVTASGIGPVTVTATQAGNRDFAPATPVTVSFNAVRAPLNVYVQSASRPVGAPNPTFQYSLQTTGISDPVAPPYVSGVPDLATTATQSSPPGPYPIVATQGTLTAEHYFFVFINGTLTVTSASSYILTTTPTSLTVPRGSARQLTVTVTQVNNYSGSVTMGCDGLPAGISCSFSPAAINIPAPTVAGDVTPPIQGTLTITANGSTASAAPLDAPGRGMPLAASFFILPAGLGGLFLLVGRRRFLKGAGAWNGLVLAMLVCFFGVMTACSGGSTSTAEAAPKTSLIQITGSGTPSAGASDLTQSVSLSLTVQ